MIILSVGQLIYPVFFDQCISVDNPNGWDPLFDWTIVHGNEFLEYWNVTYQDLINKPIEGLILIQGRFLSHRMIDYNL